MGRHHCLEGMALGLSPLLLNITCGHSSTEKQRINIFVYFVRLLGVFASTLCRIVSLFSLCNQLLIVLVSLQHSGHQSFLAN